MGRVGGDGDPMAYLEGIRAGIAGIDLELDGQPVRITASIGATVDPGADLDAMLALADAAVYQAKGQGRNRVVLR